MIVVACSGFPVPVSRYWGEFLAVEISDTELGIPGQGTVRRWKRESPKGFVFSMIAPKIIGESSFKVDDQSRQAVASIVELSNTLEAIAVVFAAPETFKHGKSSRDALNAFTKIIPKDIAHFVLDLPAWTPEQITAGVADSRVVPAWDPLGKRKLKGEGPLAYLRLPGPAGHRSRYDEAAIEKIHKICEKTEANFDTVMCVFQNIDMRTNGQQLLKLLQ